MWYPIREMVRCIRCKASFTEYSTLVVHIRDYHPTTHKSISKWLMPVSDKLEDAELLAAEGMIGYVERKVK